MAWNKGSSSSIVPEKSVELSAQIDEGAELDGKLAFTGTVRLNCKIHGEIVSNGFLIIGEKAIINATIRSRIVRVEGEVTGDVYATERLELHTTARVHGDLEAPAVVLAEGAFFEGQVRMTVNQAAESVAPRARDFTLMPPRRSEVSR